MICTQIMANLIYLTKEFWFTLIDLLGSFSDNYESELRQVDKEISLF